MQMCEADFLRVLTRTIQLHDKLRLHTTPYRKFSYDLTVLNGTLTLTINYPTMGRAVVVSYNSKQCADVYALLDDAETYLKSLVRV